MTVGRPPSSSLDLDARPLVGSDRGNFPLWLGFVAIALIAAVLLVVLESRRQRQQVAPVRASVADDAQMRPYKAPALVLPPLQDEASVLREDELERDPPEFIAPQTSVPQPAVPPTIYAAPQPPSTGPTPAPQQNVGNASAAPSAIVFDVSAAESAVPVAGQAATTPAASSRSDGPAFARQGRASRLTTMVPRGTLIPAILETALDSTQPGQARAVISDDVFNLNGDRVLIPRGSRLFGEYRADLAPGQKRAFVQWNQLIRPDGVVIAIESPATDPLGRAGIRGRVNSNFAGRLGGALLQLFPVSTNGTDLRL